MDVHRVLYEHRQMILGCFHGIFCMSESPKKSETRSIGPTTSPRSHLCPWCQRLLVAACQTSPLDLTKRAAKMSGERRAATNRAAAGAAKAAGAELVGLEAIRAPGGFRWVEAQQSSQASQQIVKLQLLTWHAKPRHVPHLSESLGPSKAESQRNI